MSGRSGADSLTMFDAVFRAECLAPFCTTPQDGGHGEAASGPAMEATVPGSASMADVVLAVAKHGSIALEASKGYLERNALESMIFRSWLFGILTFLEMRARDAVRRDPDWRALIAESRLEKAHALKDERARRGRIMATLDALQFGDVSWLAVRHDIWCTYFGVKSKRQAKRLVRQLEVLRNALAHGQDIVTHDWDAVVAVARSVIAIKEEEGRRQDPDS